MNVAVKIDVGLPVTPSETVLLYADEFSKKHKFGKFQLLDSPEKVDLSKVAHAALEAAFLASEEAGQIRLEVRDKSKWKGLRHETVLDAVPTNENINWPDPSLEGRIEAIIKRVDAEGANKAVSDIVYELLGEDSASAEKSELDLMMSDMANRNLLASEQKKKFMVFKSMVFRFTQETANFKEKHNCEEIQSLIKECQEGRPDLWKLLKKEISQGLSRRTELGSGGGGGDFD